MNHKVICDHFNNRPLYSQYLNLHKIQKSTFQAIQNIKKQFEDHIKWTKHSSHSTLETDQGTVLLEATTAQR